VIGCFENLDATCLRHPCEGHPKLAIILTDEILRTRAIGGGLPNRYAPSKRRWEIVSRLHGSLCGSAARQ
jgi:hypothetical protein